MSRLEFRWAEEKAAALICRFSRKLAAYEKLSDQVVATEPLLREWIFEKKKAEVLFPMEEGEEVGFALFFHNFPTFLGRAGLYLEDLYISPEYRGKGYGRPPCKSWPKSRWSAAAAGWNGPAWIGINPALTFISPWGLSPWRSGRCTA